MKILKYLLLLILLVVIGGAIYVATRPNDFDISRSVVINAPADVVYDNIKDFKKWEPWNPWTEADSTIVVSYPEKTSGIGGSYSWTSKDGPGMMKNIAMEENKSLDQELVFGDYDPNDVYWRLEDDPNGTKVTWGMKSENTPFVFKIFATMAGGMDNMLGPMYEKGLANLNQVVTEQIKRRPVPKYSIGKVTTKELPAQKFIGYHQKTDTDTDKLANLFETYLPKAGMYAFEKKLTQEDMIPGAVFTNWDPEKNEAEFYIGLLLTKNIPPGKGMQAVDLPKGKCVIVSKYGPYGIGDEKAHEAIGNFLKANNLTQNGPVIELYVNDPSSVAPEDVQTDIYYPVK